MTAPEVILVHGLYHQPQQMQPLRAALEERGAIAHVPRLHRGSLMADTGAVQQVVDACRNESVVVAHSYWEAFPNQLLNAALPTQRPWTSHLAVGSEAADGRAG